MKCIVTGAAGFIGSHLVDELIKRDYSVIGIDDLSLGNLKNLAHLINPKHPRFTFIQQDITKLSYVENEYLKESDVIFHFAANSDISKSHKNPRIDFDRTFKTTYDMLCVADIYKIKQFVFASTSAIYGDTGSLQVQENHGPLMPVSHYGAAKLASESFISSFVHNYDIRAWIIRFPNVVGSRMTHGALYDFIERLKKDSTQLEVLGNGTQHKPYIHVKDLIDAIMYSWISSSRRVNVYNVAPMDNSTTTIKNMAEWCAAEFNCNTIRYGTEDIGWVGDLNTFKYNTDKLHKLGFDLDLSSDNAVKKAIKELMNANN